MVKNKVLTPVLAGVLGLSIVGSGLGYYFVNKDSNDGKTEGGKAKLTQVADNINNTLGTAEKAIKGELDFAYNATATVSFGEGFTEQAGVSLQPISVTTVTKQKGSNTAADVSLTYGGNNLVSANAVYSRDNKSAYVQIPELSDAYLMVNVDSLKDKVGSELSSQGIDLDSLFDSAEGADVDFDTDALEKDLEEYKKVMEDSFPKPVDGEKKTGDIDGNEYSYTTKEYTISGNDVKAAFKAVLDKAKDDATLKDMFSKAGVADKLGMSYDDIISQYADSMDSLLQVIILTKLQHLTLTTAVTILRALALKKTARVQLFTPFLRTTLWLLILALTWAVRAVHHSRVLQILLTVLQMASSQ